MPARVLAVVIPLVLVAGLVAAWVTVRDDQLALADAAERTADTTAQFAFTARFRGAVDLPDVNRGRILDRLRKGRTPLSELVPRVPGASLIRRRLKEIRDGPGPLPGPAELSRLRITLGGQGVFDRRNGYRFEGTVDVRRPARLEAAYELMGWEGLLYLRSGSPAWRKVARLPASVISPFQRGLDGLAAMVRDGASGATVVGLEDVGEVPTRRFRVDSRVAAEAGFDETLGVWVGEDGLLHRVLLRRSGRGPAAVEGTLDVVLFAHGSAVRLEPPTIVGEVPTTGLPAGVERRLAELDRWLGAGA